MIKLIDYIKNLQTKKEIDPFQKKSFLNILRFFAIMIILTLIARGTAGAIMPKISLAKVTAETIVDKIDIVGQLELSNHMPIETHPNIKINEILVETGEKIEIGDSLFEYDKSEVDILVKTASAEINKLEIQHNQLLKSKIIDTTAITNATDCLAFAKED